ncbi:TPA: hypothetical protein ACKPYM_000818 [Stenotrophomonas maltophilia]
MSKTSSPNPRQRQMDAAAAIFISMALVITTSMVAIRVYAWLHPATDRVFTDWHQAFISVGNIALSALGYMLISHPQARAIAAVTMLLSTVNLTAIALN